MHLFILQGCWVQNTQNQLLGQLQGARTVVARVRDQDAGQRLRAPCAAPTPVSVLATDSFSAMVAAHAESQREASDAGGIDAGGPLSTSQSLGTSSAAPSVKMGALKRMSTMDMMRSRVSWRARNLQSHEREVSKRTPVGPRPMQEEPPAADTALTRVIMSHEASPSRAMSAPCVHSACAGDCEREATRPGEQSAPTTLALTPRRLDAPILPLFSDWSSFKHQNGNTHALRQRTTVSLGLGCVDEQFHAVVEFLEGNSDTAAGKLLNQIQVKMCEDLRAVNSLLDATSPIQCKRASPFAFDFRRSCK